MNYIETLKRNYFIDNIDLKKMEMRRLSAYYKKYGKFNKSAF